jgi:hypothetical protein
MTQRALAFIETQLPAFGPAEKSRDKHQLSGIEKVKRIAVRLDEAAFVCLQLG